MDSYKCNAEVQLNRSGSDNQSDVHSKLIGTQARIKLSVATLMLAALLVAFFPSKAAAQSSADSQISITVGEAIQITNIDDWVIGIFTANATINNWQYNWDYECVFSTSGTYRVELNSQNGFNPLKLVSSSGDQMDYEIWSYYRQGNTYRMQGPLNTPTISLTNLSASQSPTCADENYGGANLFFAALVRQAPFNQAPPGIYQDLVTLQVIPE